MDSEDQTNIDEVASNYDDMDDIDVDLDVEETEEPEVETAPRPKMEPDMEEDDDIDMEEDDDMDDDPDAERVVKKKHMHMYHQQQESTEVKIVKPSDRITSECMTIYEYSIVVGTRATHISEGAVLYTDPDGLFDPRDIAKKEINENMCPLSIMRKISPTLVELWEVNEMVKPQ